ncbi:MAG TPA: AAA family ATPase [Candidatus Saccharimonadales bacterium]|nr:AAA family ATPase [Candidatus Saccharimonadales bacterium]
MRGYGEAVMGPRQALEPDALVIVMIGASAVGKSSIAEALCENGMVEATPTWTTRSPRPGELDTSYDHHFVSDEAFDRQNQGGFIDQHSLYGYRYGVPFLSQPVAGKEALVVLKPVFMPVFLEHYPAARVYQVEASPEVLRERMQTRGQSAADIERRMQEHGSETAAAHQFAHVIFDNNGLLAETVERVAAQIRSDRAAHGGTAAADDMDEYRLADPLAAGDV